MKVVPASTGLPEALQVLKEGGVVAHATETCYGLACDLTNPNAVAKLFAIKQRPAHQPVSALFSSMDQAKQFVIWTDRAEELARQYLPGPLTLILPLRADAPRTLLSCPEGSLTLGIRLSPHPTAIALVTQFGSPISTTSANVHGQPNPYSVEDMVKQFEEQEVMPDLILDDGILPPTPPSTIIDLTKEEQTPLRKGEIKL